MAMLLEVWPHSLPRSLRSEASVLLFGEVGGSGSDPHYPAWLLLRD